MCRNQRVSLCSLEFLFRLPRHRRHLLPRAWILTCPRLLHHLLRSHLDKLRYRPSLSLSPSSSPSTSEPTAPSQNGPTPTAQPNHQTNEAHQQSSPTPNLQTHSSQTSEPQIQPPLNDQITRNPRNPVTQHDKEQPQNQHPMQTRAKNKIVKPTSRFSFNASKRYLNPEPRTVA